MARLSPAAALRQLLFKKIVLYVVSSCDCSTVFPPSALRLRSSAPILILACGLQSTPRVINI